MAIVPLKQKVTITPSTGQLDEWGKPIKGEYFGLNEPYELKCRVSEETKVIVDRTTSANTHGVQSSQANSKVTLYFDKFANISIDDIITFTDENGTTYTYKPLSIEVKRGINGKPLLTVVSV